MWNDAQRTPEEVDAQLAASLQQSAEITGLQPQRTVHAAESIRAGVRRGMPPDCALRAEDAIKASLGLSQNPDYVEWRGLSVQRTTSILMEAIWTAYPETFANPREENFEDMR